jgi:hypothetical protein
MLQYTFFCKFVSLPVLVFHKSKKIRTQRSLKSDLMGQSISVTAARFQHRDLSILVGILSGTLLVVFASEDPLSNFQPIDLVIFFAVPALAGAISGFTSAGRQMENGAVVGVVIGLVYAIINGLRLGSSAAGEQVLFLILTIPIWGFLGAYGAVLAHRTLEGSAMENHVLPWPDDTPRAGPVQGPKICENCKTANPADALFCKNCGTKLGLVSSRT